MMRALFWIALIILVVMAVRAKIRAMTPKDEGPLQRPGRPPEVEGEAMACCAHCHIYFPASEAVRADGLDYCCAAHVRQPAKQG
jgi:uncharacterized protein